MNRDAALQFDPLGQLYEDMASWPFRRHIETPSVRQALGSLDALDVADFGSGSGFYARLMKTAGARRVLGYDLADGMVDYARRRAERDGLDVAFTSALAPEHAGAFDVVLSVYVLPYATSRPELERMCAQMMGLLRPGGRLVALPIHPRYEPDPAYYEGCGFRLAPDEKAQPHRDGGRIRLDLCHEGHEASVHAWYWSKEAIDAAFTAAGASSIEWRDPAFGHDCAADDASDALRAYVARPHAAIVRCRKA